MFFLKHMIDIKNLQIVQKLKRNNLGFKLILGLVFWICLTFFLYFKQIRVETLELNSIAHRYIVAQKKFDFPDEEATVILKQKNTSDIHSIYFIEANEIKQKRSDLEKYLIENPGWKKIPDISYEGICEIADQFENILLSTRFCNAKTLKTIKKFNISTQDYLAMNVLNGQSTPLPKEYFSILVKKLPNWANISDEAVNFMIKFFDKNDYTLIEDFWTQSQIKRHIEKCIPQQYTHVNAGELVIGNREKVTSRHIAMIQAMKESLSQKIHFFQPLKIIGNFLLSFVFIFLSILYFKIEQPKLLKSLKQLSLIVTILLLTLLFSKVVEYIILKSTTTIMEATRYPIVIPFATLLFSILFDIRISLFFSTLLSIALSITLAVEHNGFLIINMITSLIVIISTRSLRKRTEVFGVCANAMLGVIFVIIGIFFIHNRMFNLSLLTNLISSFFSLLIIGIIVVGLLPVLESVFDVLTDITLMEYMDPNNELLRRLTLEIPGSYQHSLVLGNLAEAAAQEIKANALFCRVATLYHDIGKLNNPNYFIENQSSGINIHQLLTPLESAQVIISHVIDGEMLGKKYRLPKKIIEVIRQHHGTTLVYYFFRKEGELKGKEIVDQNPFRYPGPKPQTKEAAIIMIADSVEAASRSLEKISEKILSALVNRIVKEKAEDGQFDDCSLTFEELKIVKRSIVKTLMLTRHLRIKYPDKKEEKLNIYLEPCCIDKSV
jgi:cyclic-di-AMP phosphodiesterase PgpH